jgi:GH25 family lysozyme M1 (1,4-beta-N-acetylmuramidase)
MHLNDYYISILGGFKMKGIDISSHNGNIDFEAVKNDGVEVVIIKATEGVDFRDECLEIYYNGAKNSGIPHIGFYHFMSEKTSPTIQAEDFYNAIKDKEYDIKPCLDVETNNIERSSEEITDRCLEFVSHFKEISEQDCIIYSGAYFAQDNLDERLGNSSWLWIAHYGVDKPMKIPKWGEYVGHQYSESGSVNGVNGNVDMNNFYDNRLMFLNNINISQYSVQATTEIVNSIVSELQELINEQGFGPITVDGILGHETLSHCPIIKEGSSYGQIVAWIQLRVGFTGDDVDGVFGENTKNAVIGFQDSRGLAPDGIVGENTWSKLSGM